MSVSVVMGGERRIDRQSRSFFTIFFFLFVFFSTQEGKATELYHIALHKIGEAGGLLKSGGKKKMSPKCRHGDCIVGDLGLAWRACTHRGRCARVVRRRRRGPLHDCDGLKLLSLLQLAERRETNKIKKCFPRVRCSQLWGSETAFLFLALGVRSTLSFTPPRNRRGPRS